MLKEDYFLDISTTMEKYKYHHKATWLTIPVMHANYWLPYSQKKMGAHFCLVGKTYLN
jgi:hypothetical protein